MQLTLSIDNSEEQELSRAVCHDGFAGDTDIYHLPVSPSSITESSDQQGIAYLCGAFP